MKLENVLTNKVEDTMKELKYTYHSVVSKIVALSKIDACIIDGSVNYGILSVYTATWTLKLFTNIELDSLSSEEFDKLVESGLYDKILNGIAHSKYRDDYKRFVEMINKTIEDSKSFTSQMSIAISKLSNIPQENLQMIGKMLGSEGLKRDVAIKEAQKQIKKEKTKENG